MKNQKVVHALNGIFAVYKPKGWTSRAATNKVQHFLSQQLSASESLGNDPKIRNKRRPRIKIGHGGTLEYEVIAKFGQATDTYDSEGQVTHQGCIDHLTREKVEAVLPRFRGEISQVPPIMDGKRLYDYARQGETLPRPIEARKVEIHRLELVSYKTDECILKVESGKGTYMRSLVHDLGLALGTYAHMIGLKRTRQAAWTWKEAIPIDKKISLDHILNIFKHLSKPKDYLNCALTCKAWSYHALELLWFKPDIRTDKEWIAFCKVLCKSKSLMFPYTTFIRRLNLSTVGKDVTDEYLACLNVCERLERITLTGCSSLTDEGLLALLSGSACKNLVSMDLSDISNVTDATIRMIAANCPKLQGLNLSMCKEEGFTGVTDCGIVKLAERCTGLRRIKLNNCSMLTDISAIKLAENCPALLEIDLMNCPITNESLYAIFAHCHELREFRLNQCIILNDAAFVHSALATACPSGNYYEQLRILDLTAVTSITDQAVRQIVRSAPKIRNLVLNKCHNVTDDSVFAICGLGRYLHYLHLGHCGHLTDESIVQLARNCTRIRYLDLACCSQLTDRSVIELATLQKLKRIGLVKCNNITDNSIYALTNHVRIANSLERVHLSYCIKLTVPAITQLLNFCHRLTHLSLTQVAAFLRPDIRQFCRKPPKEFTLQQRNVFCVFSGDGVRDLRLYLSSRQLMSEEDRVPKRLPAPPVENIRQAVAVGDDADDADQDGFADVAEE
ncbi:SCF ubiquitin ligase complex subunit [Apophysomyces ossiformis]|uniref:SCF ubiquitin ligase complex subunit n=1 Tax=Apophysomyces ossiformis TaxID=679940 RepID=A0A8H7BVY8_9FUNG|nr:SCF ubiquitin ligase complex subunit [Apophysomyces ossiformis]